MTRPFAIRNINCYFNNSYLFNVDEGYSLI